MAGCPQGLAAQPQKEIGSRPDAGSQRRARGAGSLLPLCGLCSLSPTLSLGPLPPDQHLVQVYFYWRFNSFRQLVIIFVPFRFHRCESYNVKVTILT